MLQKKDQVTNAFLLEKVCKNTFTEEKAKHVEIKCVKKVIYSERKDSHKIRKIIWNNRRTSKKFHGNY